MKPERSRQQRRLGLAHAAGHPGGSGAYPAGSSREGAGCGGGDWRVGGGAQARWHDPASAALLLRMGNVAELQVRSEARRKRRPGAHLGWRAGCAVLAGEVERAAAQRGSGDAEPRLGCFPGPLRVGAGVEAKPGPAEPGAGMQFELGS